MSKHRSDDKVSSNKEEEGLDDHVPAKKISKLGFRDRKVIACDTTQITTLTLFHAYFKLIFMVFCSICIR